MIQLGKYNKLKVISRDREGLFLEGNDKWGDVLLPTKLVPAGLHVGDEVDVFVYFDTEDLIVATTKKPLATIGEFAALTVVSEESFGIFLDWGLEKDLFVPFREQLFKMIPGESYVVYLYLDSSDRIAASTRINKFIDTSTPDYSVGDSVDLLLYQATDLGLKAIVDGKHSGLIFKDDIINNLKLGQSVEGYIKNIREDGKIDLSLTPLQNRDQSSSLSDQILQRLEESGGTLDITAKSSAELVNSMFNVSRKKFKIALGGLYKKRLITIEDDKISLIK